MSHQDLHVSDAATSSTVQPAARQQYSAVAERPVMVLSRSETSHPMKLMQSAHRGSQMGSCQHCSCQRRTGHPRFNLPDAVLHQQPRSDWPILISIDLLLRLRRDHWHRYELETGLRNLVQQSVKPHQAFRGQSEWLRSSANGQLTSVACRRSKHSRATESTSHGHRLENRHAVSTLHRKWNCMRLKQHRFWTASSKKFR